MSAVAARATSARPTSTCFGWSPTGPGWPPRRPSPGWNGRPPPACRLPPLLRAAHGTTEPLSARLDLPLGAYPNAPRHVTTVRVPYALLMYTDGLVERRDRPLAEGIAELRRVLGGDTADELCM